MDFNCSTSPENPLLNNKPKALSLISNVIYLNYNTILIISVIDSIKLKKCYWIRYMHGIWKQTSKICVYTTGYVSVHVGFSVIDLYLHNQFNKLNQ